MENNFNLQINSKTEMESSTIRNALLSIAGGIVTIALAFGVTIPQDWIDSALRAAEGAFMIYCGYKCRKGRINATRPIQKS